MTAALKVVLKDRAQRAGLTLAEPQLTLLSRFYQLLARWNRTINLTGFRLGDTAEPAVIDRLLVEPLLGSPFVRSGIGRWLDVGSGAGSPAIPLKILHPDVPLTLVESRGRKCAFLRETVRELGLTDVRVVNGRVEALAESLANGVFELVTARAVRPTPLLLDAIVRMMSRSATLLFYGAEGAFAGAHQGLLAARGLDATAFPLLDSADRLYVIRRVGV